MLLTNRDGVLRLYDSTATPYYLEIKFTKGDFNFPMGVPKTEEILKLNRGRHDSDAHYIEGSDEKVMASIPVSFSVSCEDTTITDYLLDWLEGNTVNAHTIATTKADTNRDGATATPSFRDTTKLASNMEILFTAGSGGTDIGWTINEIEFPLADQSIAEGEEEVTISLAGQCYGTIVRMAAFTAGTDATA